MHSLALFNTDEELERIRVAVHEMVERAIKLDGTCSGEHGVGVGKVEYLDTELGRGTVNLMETVKRSRECTTCLEAVWLMIVVSRPGQSVQPGQGESKSTE